MKKAGILGGGQLGRMLLQAAANYPVETYVMENDPNCPAAHLCHHFVKGDITDYNDVYNFGKGLDVISIEIESVNLEALEKLESEGVKVYPKPAALKIIKNKIEQKEFYKQHQIPTSEFVVTANFAELEAQVNFLPAVHKLALGGYDGKGVEVLKNKDDLKDWLIKQGVPNGDVQVSQTRNLYEKKFDEVEEVKKNLQSLLITLCK